MLCRTRKKGNTDSNLKMPSGYFSPAFTESPFCTHCYDRQAKATKEIKCSLLVLDKHIISTHGAIIFSAIMFSV